MFTYYISSTGCRLCLSVYFSHLQSVSFDALTCASGVCVCVQMLRMNAWLCNNAIEPKHTHFLNAAVVAVAVVIFYLLCLFLFLLLLYLTSFHEEHVFVHCLCAVLSLSLSHVPLQLEIMSFSTINVLQFVYLHYTLLSLSASPSPFCPSFNSIITAQK